jgi:uncharacterized protein YprB with RNaseH-like and TPR domain
MISFGWKFLGEKNAHVKTVLDYPHNRYLTDKRLIQDVYDIMSGADIWVGHYSTRFDTPFVQTRLLAHYSKCLPPVPQIDTWWIARTKLKLHSNRLASIQQFLELPTSKTPLKPEHWVKATQGHPESIKYISEHNLADVECLEQAYMRLRPLIHNHPSVNCAAGNSDGCPVCGSLKVHHVRERWNRITLAPLFKCTDCGAWSQGNMEKIKGKGLR